MFLARCGYDWIARPGDADAEVVEKLAAGEPPEPDFIAWVRSRAK